MVTSAIDFPTWFSAGCYGGLACCMFAIAANALYTALCRRGTTRQLTGAIVTCVISALLLLLALFWYNLRFQTKQATLPLAEIEVALAYVALVGWILPLGVTATFYLFTLPRSATITSVNLPRMKRGKQQKEAQTGRLDDQSPPRYLAGKIAPFVYSEDTPWGWLEYGSGNFQGQRLALKRAIATIGRDEDNDIWIDDDMASRHHAELAWDKGKTYVTDCESLNGIKLNGAKLRGFTQLHTNDVIEVGSHRFIFIEAEYQEAPLDHDPLANHKWRTAKLEPETIDDENLPATRPLEDDMPVHKSASPITPPPTVPEGTMDELVAASNDNNWQKTETNKIDRAAPLSLPSKLGGALYIRDGEMGGLSFLLDRPVVTVGRGIESDVVIHDSSISRRHVQFLRQADGDYVQDLASSNGTTVNSEPLQNPRLLKTGDVIRIGNIELEYSSVPMARTSPLTQIITPWPAMPGPTSPNTLNGPIPLRLPSKQKEQG